MASHIDLSSRDNDAKVTFYVPLWKRNGITLDQFDDYWRDVHGPVCARLPGQFQYWQWHVAHNEGGIFPGVRGVDSGSAPDEQFDGIAELTFKSVEDRQTWFDASAILMGDEHNIFSKAIGYVSSPGNSRTYLDRFTVGDPNGTQGGVKYHVMVKQKEGISVDAFRSYMTDQFAASVVKSDHLHKFRLHLFEPPDVSRPDAAGVSHSDPPERLFQAAYEIGFPTGLARERFLASSEYSSAVEAQAQYVRQVSPYPERSGFTFVYEGRMTLAGRRGSSTAGLITDLGATNQTRENIAELLGIREPNQ